MADGLPAAQEREAPLPQSEFPPGWDEERVKRLIAHYEHQSEEDAVAEDEAAFHGDAETVMTIPRELVPLVRELIARHTA